MKKALWLLALATAALLFLLVFSWSSSPLSPACDGSDAAFFRLVGEGMQEGRLPYRDYFDMKGPWLFFLEGLAQFLLRGRLGILLIQWVNFFVVLLLSDAVLREAKQSLLLRVIGLGIVMIASALTLQEGNLTEEYSLPFLLMSLLLTVRYLKKAAAAETAAPHSPLAGLWHGFAFGFLALVRITNAALIGAAVLTVSICLIAGKQWKNLLGNGAAFLGGLLLAFAPPCLYYYSQGLLSEMLSQVFLFGFLYSGESSLPEQAMIALQTLPRLIPILFPIPALLLILRKGKKNAAWIVLTVSGVAATLLAVLMGNGYYHYYQLGIPLIVLALFFLMQADSSPRRAGAAVLTVLLLLSQAGDLRTLVYRTRLYLTQSEQGQYGKDALAIGEAVPEAERGSVLAWDVMPDVYILSSLQPCIRYCAWQEHYIALSPEIAGEIALLDGETPILWLITGAGCDAPECLKPAEWDCSLSTANFTLWRRNLK